MNFGQKLKKLRKEKDTTQQELADLLKVGRSTIAGYETKGKKPDYDKLQKLAIYFNVSIDYLVGESASSIIEDKLAELGMTLEELAEKSGVPLTFLKNLDDIVPDYEPDLGEQCYKYITGIAWILGLPCGRLRMAFARQEIPAYDGPTSTPEEDFFDEEPTSTLTPREERDIAKDLEKMLSNLESNEALAFNGEPLDEETKELMRISLESSMRMGKQIAKQKFTPKKYKK